MRSRDGVSEPTVWWWQEGELSTVNWAVIDCFLPHNRYHRPANYTPDQQRLFVMQIQEFLCTVSGCSSMEACFMVLTKVWACTAALVTELLDSLPPPRPVVTTFHLSGELLLCLLILDCSIKIFDQNCLQMCQVKWSYLSSLLMILFIGFVGRNFLFRVSSRKLEINFLM